MIINDSKHNINGYCALFLHNKFTYQNKYAHKNSVEKGLRPSHIIFNRIMCRKQNFNP